MSCVNLIVYIIQKKRAGQVLSPSESLYCARLCSPAIDEVKVVAGDVVEGAGADAKRVSTEEAERDALGELVAVVVVVVCVAGRRLDCFLAFFAWARISRSRSSSLKSSSPAGGSSSYRQEASHPTGWLLRTRSAKTNCVEWTVGAQKTLEPIAMELTTALSCGLIRIA